MKTETDKRVIKTKTAIRRAFNELVQQKDMSDITISELVERANITRSTFYVYYDTVAAVRDDIENEIFSHIDRIMDEQDWLKSLVDPYPLLSKIAGEIAQYDEYNRYILSSTNSGRLFEKLNQKVVAAFLQFVSVHHVDIDAARAKYIAAFVTAGISECFKLWFNHQSSLTLEELCQRISEIIPRGLAILRELS